MSIKIRMEPSGAFAVHMDSFTFDKPKRERSAQVRSTSLMTAENIVVEVYNLNGDVLYGKGRATAMHYPDGTGFSFSITMRPLDTSIFPMEKELA